MIAVEIVFDLFYLIHYNCDITKLDRLHNVITPHILISFLLFTLFRYFGDEHMLCYRNAYELAKWTPYIESYCFVENKYFVSPYETRFPTRNNTTHRRNAMYVDYYQWIPIMFFLQSVLFCIPYWFWKAFNYKNGFSIKTLGSVIDDDHESVTHAEIFVRNLQYNYLKGLRRNYEYGIFKPTKYLSYIPRIGEQNFYII
uniref:Innexin n=1 Tax=Panagrolaimus superbus TaxID=310955 RepID=A0A914XW60_9BILA